jgi:DNA-directed RNA polymerase beta subunit/DNA-directed RNA polymerase beta' subunit
MANLNPEGEFSSLKERVKVAIVQQFPFVGRKHRLELVELDIKDDAAKPSSPFHVDNIQTQLDAKLADGTWAVPIQATLRLIDVVENKEIDRTKITLARLPKITRRYSYIVKGHERQHDSTFRLKARPYHLIADNGEIRAQWNLAKGKGFDLKIDPTTGLLKMKLGTSHIPLYQVLKTMGAQDAEIENAWGKEVSDINRKKTNPNEILKVPKSTARKPGEITSIAQAEEYTKKLFDDTRVRPDAMTAAFGKPYDRVNVENLLLSSQRLLQIARGEREEDDRQSLAAKDIASTEDYVVEAVERQTTEIRRKIMNNIDQRDTIREIISPHLYSKVIENVFTKGHLPDQTNPLEFVSSYLRTTVFNPEFGGIKGEHANLDRDQLVNPSHLGFLDPIQTPEKEAGLVLHLPIGVQKKGKELLISVWDTKEGKMVQATPGMLEHAIVAYPDQVKWVDGKPRPVADTVSTYDENRNTSLRPWKDVRYVLRSSKGVFSFGTNLMPFLQNDSAGRAMMAAKQQEQAVSLVNREAPLVQSKSESALTFERILGVLNSHVSPVEGTITKVSPDAVSIRSSDGKAARVQLYNNYPLNGGRNLLNSEALVKAGDKVRKGQLIADSNYSKDGVLALGTNIRTAYLPYHGLNFEDGVVISESASEMMTSDHLMLESATVYPGMLLDKKRWHDYSLPEKATPERMSKLGDDGIVRIGEKVVYGDVLIALLIPASFSKDALMLQSISRSLVKDFRDRSVVWNHEYPGIVTRVNHVGRRIDVYVRAQEKLGVGDKVTGRHGNKGIVSRILPDHEMPHDKDGNPVHILLNPSGIPSRMNVGQVLETAASKIAEKTGKPYVVENFVPGVDYSQKVKDELKQHGLSDTEELFDPKTGKSLGQVLVGKPYMLKLHHMVEKKMTARSHGGAYTATGEPPSGSGIPGGGQKMDMLGTYAMLAHGATANLREAMTFKSDSDQNDVWIAVQTGRPLPDPKPSRGMNQLVDYMKGMGIHAEKKGDKYVLAPLTDKQTLSMSNGEIRFPDKALLAKGIRTLEETGGLFDPKATGGLDGKFWGHVNLQQRIPNPVFEPAILSLTDMKEKEFEELVGPNVSQSGKSGFDIIAKKLKAVDVDKELKEAEARLPKLNGPALNKEYRKVRYLRALKQNDITPFDAYTNKILPVVPPAIRKVSIGLDGKQIFDDLNGLYLSVGQINEQLRKADPSTPKSEIQKMQAHLYDAVRALRISGLDMGEGAKKRHHFGIMEKLSGTKPKESFYQDGVLSRRQDLSGRSTIVPAPELGLDEVGVPLPIAMEMYKPFVVKELHKNRGYTPLQAQKLIKEKGPAAVEALNKVVMDRPVLMKRDPVLHKYGVQAFYPRITSGKAIGIHPLVCAGYNADFDGDAMSLFVPVSTEAVDESKKMLPSRNLFSPTNQNIMTVPGQDSLLGLFQLTAWGKAGKFPPNTTPERMIELFHAGKCSASDVVTYQGRKTTVGRLALAQHLPKAMKDDPRVLFDSEFRLDKKQLSAFLSEVGKAHTTEFPNMVDRWKDLGTKNAFLQGSSISINDFHDGKEFRDSVLKKYQREEGNIRRSNSSQLEQDKKVVDLYQKAQTELKATGQERYKRSTDNGMYEWVRAGAKGNWDQFSQMVFGPILVADAKNKPVAIPITSSYGEGLPFSQYWASLHGARKGAIDRGSNTADPGAVTKDIINTVINHRVVARDCGTEKGIAIDPNDPRSDADGRFLAKPVALKGGEVVPARTLLTPPLIARIRNSGIQKIVVRSPLYCQEPNGVCAMCYGHNSDGRLYPIGANVGVIAGQSMGEPVTQMTMRCNAAGNLITLRKGKDIFTCSLGQLWQMIPGPHRVDEDWHGTEVETKATASFEVWDHDRFVKVRTIQRHLHDDRMMIARTAGGSAFISQGNHPNWAREAAPVCACYGSSEPHRFIGHGTRGSEETTSLRCRTCRKATTVLKAEYEGSQERIVFTENLEGKLIGVSSPPPDTGEFGLPLPPYLMGMWMAEGCLRLEKNERGVEEGTKRRESSSHSNAIKLHSVIISQKPGEIHDHILRELEDSGFEYTVSGKNITFGNVEFAQELWKFGVSSSTKGLPPGFMAMKEGDALEFLAGYFDGDGTCRETDAAIDTTSWLMASQLAALARKIGARTALYKTPWREASQHQGYRIAFWLPQTSPLPSIKSLPTHPMDASLPPHYEGVEAVQEVEYEGYAYDIATESRAFSSNGIRTHNTFHTGGVVGTAVKAVNAFDRVKDLIHVPKILKNEATLASVDGTISSMTKNVALGGHDVVIGNITHRIPALLEPLPHIVPGTVVKKAEPLSTGPINPHHLLEHTGNMNIVRNYITDEIEKVYGSDTKRRNIETVVKAMTNVTHIDDSAGHPSYLRGQLAPLSLIEHENREATKAGLPTIQHTPMLRPMKQVPLEVQEDWMARMNYQRLEHTMREGAAQGWHSDIHGHPIPGLAHGAEFGLRLLPGESDAPRQATLANPPPGMVKKTLSGFLSKLK